MSELESDLAATAQGTTRIPANIMALLRQSYDTREKVLDWVLSFAVAGACIYIFRDEIRLMALGPAVGGPDAGRENSDAIPNNDLRSAFPMSAIRPDIYTYNMPSSRALRQGRTTSVTPPPTSPEQPPYHPEDE